MKRSPLKRSRVQVKRRRTGAPRRGRVVNLPFMAMVRERGCILRKRSDHYCDAPCTFHHVRECGSPKDDTRGIGLCPSLHMHDFSPFSIERLGKEGFEERWSVNIEEEIAANVAAWAERNG